MRAVRVLLLVVVIVILQVTVFPHLRLFGVVPDLGLLGYDLFLETPLGLSALAYALVGYGVGIIESSLLRSPRWLPSLLGFVGGLVGGLLIISIGVLVGIDGVKGAHGVQTVLLAALYDALLAPFVFFLVRKVLGTPDRVAGPWSN